MGRNESNQTNKINNNRKTSPISKKSDISAYVIRYVLGLEKESNSWKCIGPSRFQLLGAGSVELSIMFFYNLGSWKRFGSDTWAHKQRHHLKT